LVTYIPRLIPFLMIKQIKLPSFLEQFLSYIPFAALGALIFPQVFFSAGEKNLLPATVATIVCMILAWNRMNVIVVVLAGILITCLLTQTPLFK
jgi:branched-subunit amino acid transport protein